MKLFRSSIRQLTLLGSLIIALPLILALINTMMKVDELALTMYDVVETTSQSVDLGRVVVNNALSMERSASQYFVLKDQALLEKYMSLRNQMMDAVARLNLYVPEDSTVSAHLRSLLDKESLLFQRLNRVSLLKEDGDLEVGELELSDIVRPLPGDIALLVTEQSKKITRRIESIKKRLYWQLFGLLPLFLIMAVVFSYLITRPLKRLGRSIYQLGEGDLTEKIEPYGPQDIRSLTSRLDWLRQRLSEIDEQKLTFLQHVSHELKTPLTSIREGVDLLQDGIVGELNQDQLEIVQILTRNSQQLQEEVEALLNFNNALVGKPLDPEILDMSRLIYQVVKEQQLAAKARCITLRLKLQKLNVAGDWQQLRVLIGNLLTNAIKYSPDGETITVQLWSDEGIAIVDVTDRGAGISAHDHKQVFEPFFQGSRLPKGHIKGTGLGLAIAQRYAILHHGSLELLETDIGAHFRLTLPVYSGENDEFSS